MSGRWQAAELLTIGATPPGLVIGLIIFRLEANANIGFRDPGSSVEGNA